jgi:hypothetical protein
MRCYHQLQYTVIFPSPTRHLQSRGLLIVIEVVPSPLAYQKHTNTSEILTRRSRHLTWRALRMRWYHRLWRTVVTAVPLRYELLYIAHGQVPSSKLASSSLLSSSSSSHSSSSNHSSNPRSFSNSGSPSSIAISWIRSERMLATGGISAAGSAASVRSVSVSLRSIVSSTSGLSRSGAKLRTRMTLVGRMRTRASGRPGCSASMRWRQRRVWLEVSDDSVGLRVRL